MKVKSLLFGLTVALIFFISIPAGLIWLNSALSLSLYTFPIAKAMGFILSLTGFLLFFYCFNLFILLGKGTPVPIEPPNKLVSNKLYKYSRNPIYIGYFMMLFGIAFYFGHLLLFVYALLSIPGIHFYVVSFEEPVLLKRFGKSYTEYYKATPRWL